MGFPKIILENRKSKKKSFLLSKICLAVLSLDILDSQEWPLKNHTGERCTNIYFMAEQTYLHIVE